MDQLDRLEVLEKPPETSFLEGQISAADGLPVSTPSSPSDLISQELLPLALEVLRDLMVSAKSEKVRLDAANSVTELQGLRNRPLTSLGLTFQMPPEYLSNALRGLSKLSLPPQEPIDVES